MLHRLLRLALAVPMLANAQSLPWTWLHPYPIGHMVLDLDMIDAQTGWALANGGYLLRTSDGGASWQIHDVGLWQYAIDMQFVGADTGWITVDHAGLLRTTDGGQSWSAMNTGQSGGAWEVAHTYFADALHGWLVYADGSVRATTDGGTSWQPQVSNTTTYLNDVCFADALTGCAVGGDGTIIRTTDGGQTWTLPNSGTTGQLMSVTFADAQNAWVLAQGDSILYHSSDAGQTWGPVNTGYSLWGASIYFRTPQEGWVLTAQASQGMLHTTDGGQSWAPVSTGTVEVSALEYTDALHGVGGGFCASMGYTNDGGGTWNNVSSGPIDAWQDLQFVDALTGYACGQENVLRTTDAGATWLSLNVPDDIFSTLHFISPLEGWIGGGSWEPNRIYHTVDGGQSWDTIPLPTEDFVYDIWFTDAMHGWVASDVSGRISRTTDGGINWTTMDPSIINPVTFTRVQFVDTLHGWLVGAGSQRYWSDDGGITWNPSYTAGNHTYWGLEFRDSLVGVVCADTTIMYTTDGGLTWTDAQLNAQPPTHYGLRTVAFTSPDDVWCTGYQGSVLRSTDAGQTWTELEQGRTPFYKFSWSGQALYAGGGCGAIVRLDDLSVPVDEAPRPQYSGALYPNPNDGRSFQLSARTTPGITARLRVYDSSGRLQVEQRVNAGSTGYAIAMPATLRPGAYTVLLQDATGPAQRWPMLVAE